MQELEQSLADWARNMKELRAVKVELAHCILTEDMMVLKEQVEHLHRQWEELCLRVSVPPPLGFYSGIFIGPGRKGGTGWQTGFLLGLARFCSLGWEWGFSRCS